MSLIYVVLVLIVVGVLLWLATTYIPMNETIKRLIVAVVIIAVVWWLLSITGLLGKAEAVKLPHT